MPACSSVLYQTWLTTRQRYGRRDWTGALKFTGSPWYLRDAAVEICCYSAVGLKLWPFAYLYCERVFRGSADVQDFKFVLISRKHPVRRNDFHYAEWVREQTWTTNAFTQHPLLLVLLLLSSPAPGQTYHWLGLVKLIFMTGILIQLLAMNTLREMLFTLYQS